MGSKACVLVKHDLSDADVCIVVGEENGNSVLALGGVEIYVDNAVRALRLKLAVYKELKYRRARASEVEMRGICEEIKSDARRCGCLRGLIVSAPRGYLIGGAFVYLQAFGSLGEEECAEGDGLDDLIGERIYRDRLGCKLSASDDRLAYNVEQELAVAALGRGAEHELAACIDKSVVSGRGLYALGAVGLA